jgi:hypothetical protein
MRLFPQYDEQQTAAQHSVRRSSFVFLTGANKNRNKAGTEPEAVLNNWYKGNR